MKKQYLFFFCWLILLFIPVTSTIASDNQPSIFDEMNYRELLEVDLEMDLAAIFSNRRNSEKHKAIFSFKNKKGINREWNIKVALRGKFRRSKCENLPPIKLYFNKKDLRKAGLADFDDLKLVTHCVNDFEVAKRLLVKEYLAYKLYNQLTEESFRVQFLKINYKDSVSGNIVSQFAIVIEDLGELRDRVGAKSKKETSAIFPCKIFEDERRRLILYFQYMIGNSDWSISGMRNVKVLLKDEKCYLVPYDFDFANMIDAPYSLMYDENNTLIPKRRIYQGSKEDTENLLPTLLIFATSKDKFLRTIRKCRLLKRKERKELVEFINSFYETIGQLNMPSSVLEE